MSPRRILMTLEAAPRIWRATVDLASAQSDAGMATLLVGIGPRPSALQQAELEALPHVEALWTELPSDRDVDGPGALSATGPTLARLAGSWRADLLHLSSPSQAAALITQRPVTVASHDCPASRWHAVAGSPLPAQWDWHRQLTARGLARADAVVTPSAAHGSRLREVYGPAITSKLRIVHDATAACHRPAGAERAETVLAAGRWWDEGKGGAILDRAAARIAWPVEMAGPLNGPDGSRRALRHATALGDIDAEALAERMCHAAIFTSPARHAPFGAHVLDAAAHGCALVLSDIPSFRELWEEAAVFTPAGDAQALADAVNGLAADAPRRQVLAQKAAQRARHFTAPARAAAMRAAWDHALRRSAASLVSLGA